VANKETDQSRAINIPFISPHIFSLSVDFDFNVAPSSLAGDAATIFTAAPISQICLIVRSNARSDTRSAARWTIDKSLDAIDRSARIVKFAFASSDSLAGSEFPRIKL